MFGILKVTGVKEERLKLILGDDAIFFNVMFPHRVVELLLGYLVTHFGQRRDYIFPRYVAGIVRVKLTENGVQLVFVEEHLNIEGRGQELRVVNLVVAKIIHLSYYLFNLL